MQRSGFRFVLLILLLSRARQAQAGEPAVPVKTATGIAEEARRAFDLGHAEEAIEGFSRAYELSGDSSLLFDMAEAHRQLGHQTAASRLYQTYLRRDPNGPHRQVVRKRIQEIEGAGGLKSDASVVGVPAPIPPSMPPSPPPPATAMPIAPPAGGVAAKSLPANAPASPPPPPSWRPTQSPASDIVAPAAVDLRAKPGPVPESRMRPLPRWLPWALAGTTVALGAGAIAYGVSATNRYDQLSTSCGQTADGCTSDQLQQVRSRALKANILWALAGAAALGTGVVVYVDVRRGGVAALWRF